MKAPEEWATLPLHRGARAVVTAGASGIGRAIADRLISQGCHVAICDISDEELASYSAAHPEHLAVKADVSDELQVNRFFEQVGNELCGLDILINNAGIAGETGQIENLDADAWRRCVNVGLTGHFLCAAQAVPMIRAAGGGSIVNISSVAGKFGYAFRTPYASVKYGVIGLTESLAKETGGDAIRVNAVLPGIVEGPRIQQVIAARAVTEGVSVEEMTCRYLANISMKTMVQAKDIAELVSFLVSPLCRYVSGQAIAVCGNVETL